MHTDPPDGEDWKTIPDGFSCGADLVRHIRQEFGDYFTIGVAGKDNFCCVCVCIVHLVHVCVQAHQHFSFK